MTPLREKLAAILGTPASPEKASALATFMGVSRPTIERWADGRNSPHEYMLEGVMADLIRYRSVGEKREILEEARTVQHMVIRAQRLLNEPDFIEEAKDALELAEASLSRLRSLVLFFGDSDGT